MRVGVGGACCTKPDVYFFFFAPELLNFERRTAFRRLSLPQRRWWPAVRLWVYLDIFIAARHAQCHASVGAPQAQWQNTRQQQPQQASRRCRPSRRLCRRRTSRRAHLRRHRRSCQERSSSSSSQSKKSKKGRSKHSRRQRKRRHQPPQQQQKQQQRWRWALVLCPSRVQARLRRARCGTG